MLSIPRGLYPCWPGFSLKLDNDLSLSTGDIVYLSGANGSGKSTFIKRILLPRAQSNVKDYYLLYLEQLLYLQAYAIKAEAAIKHPEKKLHHSSACLDYLFFDLEKAQSCETRPVFAFADESHNLLQLYNYLENSGYQYCLIYSIHGENAFPEPHKTIYFMPENPELSIVR